ncbi:MAG: DUF1501 domain-containing protein [Limisphaerales bacterium]
MPKNLPTSRSVTRREFLWKFGGGLGGVAMAHLLGESGLLADTPRPEFNGGLHHPAKIKRVIQLFMNGGASQCDLFDYKPELIKRSGQKFDPGEKVEAATSTPGNMMKSPFDWKQHGQSGRWVSSAIPHMSECVDDMTFLMAMHSKTNVHGPGVYLQTTGFLLPGFPCMGAWISYGLGSLNQNLPTFVVLPDSRGLPYNAKSSFSSGFLPVMHQGTIIKAAAQNPIADLFPPDTAKFVTKSAETNGLALLQKLNRTYAQQHPGDTRLDARIASYELAARMQLSAPDVLNLTGETEVTKKLYGLDKKETENFGRNCLLARRLIERDVRFVQVWSGTNGSSENWDNHADIKKELGYITNAVDQPIAALIKDMKTRGLFKDTLLIWTTEFGRMPFSQGSVGRDHNGGTFVTWMMGPGLKPGYSHGESDGWSWRAAKNQTDCYDMHATILHLLGINHEKLTFRHNGINRRLTDVHGEVISEVLT